MLAMHQKLLDHEIKSVKTAEATGGLIGNKIANRITKVSKNSQQNISETVTNEHDKEILEEIFISPGERQEIIDGLRLKLYNNEISKISEKVTNENDKEIPKERYISPKKTENY